MTHFTSKPLATSAIEWTHAEIRDQDVRVQLRIAGPRRPMPERRRHEPGRLLDDRAAVPAPNRRRRPLEIPDRLAHRDVVSRPNAPAQLVVAEPEQHADALRRRERQIEPGDPRAARRRPQLRRRPAGRALRAPAAARPPRPRRQARARERAAPIHTPRASPGPT